MPVSTLILTGTIGVGKTTLAESISDLLLSAGIRYGFIDLDGLGQLYPAPDPADPHNMGLQLKNLASIWGNYLAAGIERAVIAATLESRDQFDMLRAALPEAEITLLRVSARQETVEARIKARNHGALLEDFLKRTEALAQTIASAFAEAPVIDNDGPPPGELAQSVLEILGWDPL
jgi:thymidylate kinase